MMKKPILFLISFFLISCSKPASAIPTPTYKPTPSPSPTIVPTPNPTPTPTPTPTPPTTSETITIEDSFIEYSLQPSANKVTIEISDTLSLNLEGSFQKTEYCPDGCIVYESVYLKKEEENHIKMFENMFVKINSNYGSLTLTRIEELYLLAFNPAKQYGGMNVLVFDEDGNTIKNIQDVTLEYSSSSPNQFITKQYRTILNNKKEESIYSYDILYTVSGKLLNNEIQDKRLDTIRQIAKEKSAIASIAKIGTVQKDDSAMQTFEKSAYVNTDVFMETIDKNHSIQDEGTTLYCIVPTDKNATVAVNSYAEGKEANVLYRQEVGDPIFIISDESKAITEIVIVGEENKASFYLGGQTKDKDEKKPTLYDFSHRVYSEEEKQYIEAILKKFPEYKDYAIDTDSFSENIELEKQECTIAYFGTLHEDGRFTREHTLAISKDKKTIFTYDVVEDKWNKQ